MSAVATGRLATPHVREHPEAVGPIGRLGRWTVDHGRGVAIAWIVIAIGFGFFAPKVESALSGAGWQANGSQSVQARALIQKNFAGLSSSALMVVVHSPTQTVGDAGFRSTLAAVARTLRTNRRRRLRVCATGGRNDLGRRHTAIITAGAGGDPTVMVAAADSLKGKLRALGTAGVTVSLTGASGMWSDFNTANRTAMMKSELFSWPVTMAILVLAFGSLVAAGLPLMLTILGLVASAGAAGTTHARLRDLDLGDELRADVRARARHRLRALHRPPLPRRLLRLQVSTRVTPSP